MGSYLVLNLFYFWVTGSLPPRCRRALRGLQDDKRVSGRLHSNGRPQGSPLQVSIIGGCFVTELLKNFTRLILSSIEPISLTYQHRILLKPGHEAFPFFFIG